MKILFLCTAFNSLSQRVALVLRSRGHAVTVELALSTECMIDAANLALPDIIICPFLTKRVPPAVYNRWLTLIVHPGPPGDAGPSALDWTLLGDLGEHEVSDQELASIDAAHSKTTSRRRLRSHWGVTVLQAIEAFDAGPVWAFDQFKLDQHAGELSKSDLYRGPVTQAAVNAVLAAVEIIQIVSGQDNHKQGYSPDLLAPEFARNCCVSKGLPFQGGKTHDRPLLKASSRDFFRLSRSGQLSAEDIVQRIRCGDSQPGVLTSLFGTPLFVYSAVVQQNPLPPHFRERAKSGGPGTILATRDGAILVEIGADDPIWISHLRRPKAKMDQYLHPKLPATMVLMSMPEHASRLGLLSDVEEWSVIDSDGTDPTAPWKRRSGTYQQVWVELETYGSNGSQIGYVHSEFYNGVFSTTQCEMLLEAIKWTLRQPDLKAIVMLGGAGYFSNGIALNVIEGSPDPSAEGWANINAIDDCVEALLAPTEVLTFAAIRGNVAAGGLALATAADVVLCAETAVINPHYRGIGLYGSEWHTYSWHERCGADVAAKFARDMLPMSSQEACRIGLIDHVIGNTNMSSDRLLSDIKSTVRDIMTAKTVTAKPHIGASWTRPLRPAFNQDQRPLPEYMLQNKTEFLAHLFAGNGRDGLSTREHFRQYRRHELDQMTLDFFHPHRNQRFAIRCTAFVRKLIPASTPVRFALHRRHEGGHWHDSTSKPLHLDDEEKDDFDDLGQFQASEAVPRLPASRPEYIAAPESVGMPHEPLRHASTTSSTTGLYSEPSSASSLSTPDKEEDKPIGMQDQRPAQLIPPVQILDLKELENEPASVLPVETDLLSKPMDQQAVPSVLWSCYYSENGSERSALEELQSTSEVLDNIMRAS